MSSLLRVWTIGTNTMREAIRNKLLYALLFFAILLIGAGVIIASISYVEGSRILQDVGLASIRLRSDRETGVIDHLVALAPGVAAVFPSRVLPLPDRRSVFVFTGIQGPDQSSDQFDRDFVSLERELAGLPELFQERHADAS